MPPSNFVKSSPPQDLHKWLISSASFIAVWSFQSTIIALEFESKSGNKAKGVPFTFTGIGEDPVDVTDDALSAGQGTDGNQFVFNDEDKWQFNLKIKNYDAPGTYTITMVSGDDSEYVIDPTCEASFVIE